MNRKKRWNTSSDYLKALIVPFLIFAGLLVFLIAGVNSAKQASDRESRQFLQEALMDAVVQCYAIEGMYPPDVAYLSDHYGILIDDAKYIVHYEVFASNILPVLAVIEK